MYIIEYYTAIVKNVSILVRSTYGDVSMTHCEIQQVLKVIFTVWW